MAAGETDVKIGGTWTNIHTMNFKVSGVWQTMLNVKAKVSGVWQTVFTSGPQVSASANGDTNIRVGATCYAGARFVSTGAEQEYTSTGGVTTTGVGGDANWLDSGTGAEVWVNFVRTSGTKTAFDSLGSSRYQLSSSRGYYITRTSAGIHNITGYFQFWDAATGGNLLQQTSSATWTAEYETGA
jgi:hypothetical protein